jgi:hypothetical protein
MSAIRSTVPVLVWGAVAAVFLLPFGVLAALCTFVAVGLAVGVGGMARSAEEALFQLKHGVPSPRRAAALRRAEAAHLRSVPWNCLSGRPVQQTAASAGERPQDLVWTCCRSAASPTPRAVGPDECETCANWEPTHAVSTR